MLLSFFRLGFLFLFSFLPSENDTPVAMHSHIRTSSYPHILLAHPFYVSVAEVEHNASAKSLEISLKFFTDDFEQTVEKAYKTSLDIHASKDKASFDKLIPDYIARHFSLAADGKALKLDYVGYEVDKESAYCYFEVANVPAPKKMEIFNSLLHEFNKEQINIMHITVNGKRQSTKLTFPETKTNLIF
jgi:hypothetical protein